jgi:hypothetical protein
MYDTNELMEINLNRERTNDEIFESLVAVSSSFEGFARFYTAHKLFEAIRGLGYDINKKRFISYLETTPLYFEKRKHGERNHRFYPTDLLKQECENEIKNDQNAPR